MNANPRAFTIDVDRRNANPSKIVAAARRKAASAQRENSS